MFISTAKDFSGSGCFLTQQPNALKCIICNNVNSIQYLGGIPLKLSDFSNNNESTINVDRSANGAMKVKHLRSLVAEKTNIFNPTLVHDGILIEDEEMLLSSYNFTKETIVNYALVFQ